MLFFSGFELSFRVMHDIWNTCFVPKLMSDLFYRLSQFRMRCSISSCTGLLRGRVGGVHRTPFHRSVHLPTLLKSCRSKLGSLSQTHGCQGPIILHMKYQRSLWVTWIRQNKVAKLLKLCVINSLFYSNEGWSSLKDKITLAQKVIWFALCRDSFWKKSKLSKCLNIEIAIRISPDLHLKII